VFGALRIDRKPITGGGSGIVPSLYNATVAGAGRRVARADPFPHPQPRTSSMNIFANTAVTISFRLFDANNKLIEESPEPLVYLHGGHSGIFPKIEEALSHKKVGDSISVTLEPEDAFGEYDAKMIRIEPIADLPPDIVIGGHLVAEQDGHEVVWRVTGIADGKAVLDGNHELAGQRLRFDCTVMDIRPASQEEIAHGHVHGADGHHHH
jgi:FKBP-type peptidyl-prolyl cis-trans isomerase SlyD